MKTNNFDEFITFINIFQNKVDERLKNSILVERKWVKIFNIIEEKYEHFSSIAMVVGSHFVYQSHVRQ